MYSSQQACSFVKDLDKAIFPMRWTHDISVSSQHFLDLQITVKVEDMAATFVTGLYRKPNFKPHYLSALSMHPAAHKRGIFGCESMRALLCCSTESDFDLACKSIDSFTQKAGYPARRLPEFDPVSRSAHLARLRSRDPTAGMKSDGRRDITLVLPFVQQIAHLGLQGLWQGIVYPVIPLGFRVAFSVQPNAMRKLYRLNWTVES